MANEAEQAIYQRLSGEAGIHPASANLLLNDWTLEAGDVVTVKSGEESYRVPVYSMNMQWRGKPNVSIQSTGNREREPLPELKRKEYANRSYAYGAYRAVEEAESAFNTEINQTNHYISLIATEQDLDTLETLGATMLELTSSQIQSIAATTGATAAIPQFDPYKPGGYDIGDRVVYSDTAYQFTARHTGDWTGTDVTAVTTMQSRVTQTAGEISQIVTAVGANGQVTAASIILAINGGTGHSEAAIEADKIKVGGSGSNLITLGNVITVVGGEAFISANEVTASNLYGSTLEIGTTSDPADVVFEDGYFTCTSETRFQNSTPVNFAYGISFGDPVVYTLNATALSSMISSVELNTTTNTLTLNRFDGTHVDFSKAASTIEYTGSWSGRRYTVTANPGGVVKIGIVYDGLVNSGTVTKSGKYVYQNVSVYSDDGEGDADVLLMTKSVGINAASVYNDGWGDAKLISSYPQQETSGGSTTVAVSTPSSTVGNADANTYTLQNNGNNSVKLTWNQGAGGVGVTVAHFDHNKWTAGYNAATERTVSSLSAITLTTSDTSTSSKSTTVTYSAGSSGTATISIDASAVYSAGWTACYNSIEIEPSSNATISSATTVRAKALATPTATTKTTKASVTLTPSSGGSGNVLGYIANGTTVRTYAPTVGSGGVAYAYEWMPCQYGNYTGYIMSKFIKYTAAYNSSSGTATSSGSIQVPSSVTTYSNNATIDTSKHGTGGQVAIRSTPNT